MAINNFSKFSIKELKRLAVIHKVVDGTIQKAEAARILSLSTRQIRRIVKRVELQGDLEIRHKSRGRPSNRSYSKEIKERAIKLYRGKYKGLGPIQAVLRLSREDNIHIHNHTLRNWLIESGDWENNGKTGINMFTTVIDRGPRPRRTLQTKKVTEKGNGNSSSKKKSTANKKNGHKKKVHITSSKKKYIPSPDHPWRKLLYPQYADKYKR